MTAESGQMLTAADLGRPGGWWVDVAAASLVVGLTVALTTAPVRAIDVLLRDLGDAHRPGVAYDVVVTVNRLGSGGALTLIALGLAVVVARRRHSLWPLAPVGAALVAVVAVTEPAKRLLHRPPPHSLGAAGVSYPSGHAVNTVVWYGVICLLLGVGIGPTVRRLIRWLPPVLVTVSGTYLGFHWLTDMIAGLAVGVLVDRVIQRIGWPTLDRPQTRMISTPTAANGPTSASVASASVTRV